MSAELKELLRSSILVVYWRGRYIDTKDGTSASNYLDAMIGLESAIQDFFDGMEAFDLIETGRVGDYIDIAINNEKSTELEQLRKERDDCVKQLRGLSKNQAFLTNTPNAANRVKKLLAKLNKTEE